MPPAAMLATTALAASCCLAPGARATRRARLLAVVMAAVMAAVMLGAPAGATVAGAVALLALAVAVVREVPDGRDDRALHVAWHRAGGALLMAAAGVLMPGHDAPGSASVTAGHVGPVGLAGHAGHGGGPGAPGVLVVAALAYGAWSVATALRRRAPGGRAALLGRVEHAAMGASVALMALAMA